MSEFFIKLNTRHTFCSWLLTWVNMKWIRLILGRYRADTIMSTDRRTDERTMWNQYTPFNFVDNIMNKQSLHYPSIVLDIYMSPVHFPQQCGQCFMTSSYITHTYLANEPHITSCHRIPCLQKVKPVFAGIESVYLIMAGCLPYKTSQSTHSSCANLCILGNHDCLPVDKKWKVVPRL